jgi:hypothetical protein
VHCAAAATSDETAAATWRGSGRRSPPRTSRAGDLGGGHLGRDGGGGDRGGRQSSRSPVEPDTSDETAAHAVNPSDETAAAATSDTVTTWRGSGRRSPPRTSRAGRQSSRSPPSHLCPSLSFSVLSVEPVASRAGRHLAAAVSGEPLGRDGGDRGGGERSPPRTRRRRSPDTGQIRPPSCPVRI